MKSKMNAYATFIIKQEEAKTKPAVASDKSSFLDVNHSRDSILAKLDLEEGVSAVRDCSEKITTTEVRKKKSSPPPQQKKKPSPSPQKKQFSSSRSSSDQRESSVSLPKSDSKQQSIRVVARAFGGHSRTNSRKQTDSRGGEKDFKEDRKDFKEDRKDFKEDRNETLRKEVDDNRKLIEELKRKASTKIQEKREAEKMRAQLESKKKEEEEKEAKRKLEEKLDKLAKPKSVVEEKKTHSRFPYIGKMPFFKSKPTKSTPVVAKDSTPPLKQTAVVAPPPPVNGDNPEKDSKQLDSPASDIQTAAFNLSENNKTDASQSEVKSDSVCSPSQIENPKEAEKPSTDDNTDEDSKEPPVVTTSESSTAETVSVASQEVKTPLPCPLPNIPLPVANTTPPAAAPIISADIVRIRQEYELAVKEGKKLPFMSTVKPPPVYPSPPPTFYNSPYPATYPNTNSPTLPIDNGSNSNEQQQFHTEVAEKKEQDPVTLKKDRINDMEPLPPGVDPEDFGQEEEEEEEESKKPVDRTSDILANILPTKDQIDKQLMEAGQLYS